MIVLMLGSRRAASTDASKLANVPPEKPPFILRTRPRTESAGAPKRSCMVCCKKKTPRSNGMESKPQENTMRAPLCLAASPYLAIIAAIQFGSPQRST